jgi:hypothetical protein
VDEIEELFHFDIFFSLVDEIVVEEIGLLILPPEVNSIE